MIPRYRNRLLAALPDETLEQLTPHLARRTLTRGEVLFERGDRLTQVLFIESGMVSFLTRMRDGGEIESMATGREGAVGLMGTSSTAIALRRAVVQLPGEALAIDAAYTRAAFARSPAFRDMTMRHAASFLSQLLQLAACNASHSVEQRLARWLLLACERTDTRRLPLTQEFLSHMLGVQRTSLTRVARALQARGLIAYRHGDLDICNPIGLRAASCGCFDAMQAEIEHLLPVSHP